LQIDITGVEGDLKISNKSSFDHAEDNLIEGAQGAKTSFARLPMPAKYRRIPPSTLDISGEDLAHLYAAHLEDRRNGTQLAPDFLDGVCMHRLIEHRGFTAGHLRAEHAG
jgi:hypothetical protein